MSVDGLVTVSDIAERSGVSVEAVRKWVKRHREGEGAFPAPVGRVGRSVVWRWVDVQVWQERRGWGPFARVRVGVRVPGVLWDRVGELCVERGVGVDEGVEEALERWVDPFG